MTRELKFDVDEESAYEEPHTAIWRERGAAVGRFARALADTASSLNAACQKASSSTTRAATRFFRRAASASDLEDRHA